MLLAGCAPSFSSVDAQALAAQSQVLLAHETGDIPEASWPDAIAALDPNDVYRSPDGVYITSSIMTLMSWN
jgi:hypothetical protein